MARPASFCPSKNAGEPSKIPGEIPTKAYLLDRFVAGSFIEAGAVNGMFVPLGFAINSHFMSNAHSMVLPATTAPSFAMTFTAVQALPIKGVKAKVAATKDATIF
jgi:hypothetical protein